MGEKSRYMKCHVSASISISSPDWEYKTEMRILKYKNSQQPEQETIFFFSSKKTSQQGQLSTSSLSFRHPGDKKNIQSPDRGPEAEKQKFISVSHRITEC